MTLFECFLSKNGLAVSLTKRTIYILSFAMGIAFLAGCAGTMPKGDAEFENRIQQVVDSLSKEEALTMPLALSLRWTQKREPGYSA